jgi:hypothetical protein
MKLLYKPLGLPLGVCAGAISGALVKHLWRDVAHESATPRRPTASFPRVTGDCPGEKSQALTPQAMSPPGASGDCPRPCPRRPLVFP